MGLSDYYEDREYQFEAKISELERQLKEARAEIERKDKLIEQMREELKAAAETIHFLECERGHNFGNLLHGDLLPALEAAERMKKK